jgi:hypothetical protein
MLGHFINIFLVVTFSAVPLGSFAEEDTPVELQEIYGEIDLANAVDFRPPNYTGQDDRLGYGSGGFFGANRNGATSFFLARYLHQIQYRPGCCMTVSMFTLSMKRSTFATS